MKRLALIAGAVIGLLLITALALPFLIDPNRFRPMLEKYSRRMSRLFMLRMVCPTVRHLQANSF